jgi:hypothetical protein
MARVQAEEKGSMMELTTSFDESVTEDLRDSARFRKAFLGRVVASMLAGEVDLGKLMLRKYVNGTIGFIKLGAALGKSSKTLMQMLGPKGNPHIRNFFEIVAYLQKVEGITLQVIGPESSPKSSRTRQKKAA